VGGGGECDIYVPGPGVATSVRTNGGGRNQVLGGQSGWVSMEGEV
jgi:hypothetical protein